MILDTCGTYPHFGYIFCDTRREAKSGYPFGHFYFSAAHIGGVFLPGPHRKD